MKLSYRIGLIITFFTIAAYNTTANADFIPLGTPDLDTIEYPDDEPPSPTLVHLGKVLFFDTRLSGTNKTSCATCHNSELGLGDGMALERVPGKPHKRNIPHLYNLAWSPILLWDGRANALDKQALGPLKGAHMRLDADQALARLNQVSYYVETFQAVFPDTGLTIANVGKAIGAFERTLITRHSPFDRYIQGEFSAMSPAQIRGLALFKGKGNCVVCHDGVNFTDHGFHNIGLGDKDPGRAKIDKESGTFGAFKTPIIRNAALTAPYMHDGSIGTLEGVVRHYNSGGKKVKDLDPSMRPLQLTEQEIFDLVQFLSALTELIDIPRPQLP